MLKPKPLPIGPGQESVWSYPRPPRLEPVAARISIVFAGRQIASTTGAYRVLETSHPPTYYLPPADILGGVLQSPSPSSLCEWRGRAESLDVAVGGRRAVRAAWRYPAPSPAFASMAGYVAFYAGLMDRCAIDGEDVLPQPGSFYGGWITQNIVGPFKGEPGTMFW